MQRAKILAPSQFLLRFGRAGGFLLQHRDEGVQFAVEFGDAISGIGA